jgi:VanZ family protein
VLLSAYVLFWPDPAGAGAGPPGADKLVHAALFALLVTTARLRFGDRRRVLAAVLVYAAVSEVVQAALLARRSGDLLDLAADVTGALLAWWLLGRRDARRGAELDASGPAGGPRP